MQFVKGYEFKCQVRIPLFLLLCLSLAFPSHQPVSSIHTVDGIEFPEDVMATIENILVQLFPPPFLPPSSVLIDESPA